MKRLIWHILIVMMLVSGFAATGLAAAPCDGCAHCGGHAGLLNGPCIPNRAEWGYYQGAWRPWPGVELKPVRPARDYSQLPKEISPVELPPAEQEGVGPTIEPRATGAKPTTKPASPLEGPALPKATEPDPPPLLPLEPGDRPPQPPTGMKEASGDFPMAGFDDVPRRLPSTAAAALGPASISSPPRSLPQGPAASIGAPTTAAAKAPDMTLPRRRDADAIRSRYAATVFAPSERTRPETVQTVSHEDALWWRNPLRSPPGSPQTAAAPPAVEAPPRAMMPSDERRAGPLFQQSLELPRVNPLRSGN